ncbi:hypothetical protein CHU98_g9676 [Xylaria longipes]|nr:hypothetical protein CHU98_g9676 [Xylaria longipes]
MEVRQHITSYLVLSKSSYARPEPQGLYLAKTLHYGIASWDFHLGEILVPGSLGPLQIPRPSVLTGCVW